MHETTSKTPVTRVHSLRPNHQVDYLECSTQFRRSAVLWELKHYFSTTLMPTFSSSGLPTSLPTSLMPALNFNLSIFLYLFNCFVLHIYIYIYKTLYRLTFNFPKHL